MGGQDALLGSLNKTSSQRVQNTFEGFVEEELLTGAAMGGIDLRVDFAKKRSLLAQNSQIQKAGFERVVHIGRIVGNFIDAIDELGFERWAQIQKILRKMWKFRGGMIARMLDDAFANLKRKIQTRKIDITLLKLFNDAERV